MRILLALLTVIAFAVPAYGQVAAPTSVPFEWPTVQANAIPDQRLSRSVSEARAEARDAAGRARSGERAAAQAKRLQAVRSAVGTGAHPVTIGDETVMTANEIDMGSGVKSAFGTVTYPTGASMVGEFGPDVGIYSPDRSAVLKSFRGWVWGAQTPSPVPMIGIFEFRNGDSFSGGHSGRSARGIYSSADGQKRFVGEVDFNGGTYLPVNGILEDGQGKLLANVRAKD